MTLEQQHILIEISDKLGVADYELLYIGAMTLIDMVVAIAIYLLVIKIGRKWCRSSAS